MNRTDAAAILNIDPAASPEEARRAYQELFTEHQVRLTNAPTPALRSLYQTRILELDEAKDAFLAPALGDADSDLPTDQPSIPSPYAPAPPSAPTRAPTPPPVAQKSTSRPESRTPPPAPPSSAPADRPVEPAPTRGADAAPKKKSSAGMLIGGLIAVAVIGFIAMKVMGGKGDGAEPSKSVPAAVAATYADSLPPLRENITVARVEFGRGDYDAANSALTDADHHYAALPPEAKTDTAVKNIKGQLDQLHTKVVRACDALKKVAERHPGEPTCKSL